MEDADDYVSDDWLKEIAAEISQFIQIQFGVDVKEQLDTDAEDDDNDDKMDDEGNDVGMTGAI